MPAPDPARPDPAADLALLDAAAREAGRIAARFFDTGARAWDKPGHAGPVTEADLAVDAHLTDTLRPARPAYGWLSEETPDAADRLTHDTVFIVDPIDGTRAFIDGSHTWALSLAIAHQGTVTAGIIHLPMRDMTYAATRGGGATLNGAPLAVTDRAHLPAARVLANKWTLTDRYWPNGVPPVKRHYRPSLAYRMGLVAQGRFDAMVVFRDTWEWDIAAGTLIAQEAGATVTDAKGADLVFNKPRPAANGVFAGGTALHQQLLAAQR